MKLGKWTIINNSSEIWPLGGDCKFQFIKIVSDQLMSTLEHFCIVKDGKSRRAVSQHVLLFELRFMQKGQTHLNMFEG